MMIQAKGKWGGKFFHQKFERDELLQKGEIITKVFTHFQIHIRNTYLKASDIPESLHN